jgi:hypothetical protein
MIEEKLSWGWVRYRCTLWVSEDGRRCYEGEVESELRPGLGWNRVSVPFWSRHPVLTMRKAVSQKRTVEEMIQFFKEVSA